MPPRHGRRRLPRKRRPSSRVKRLILGGRQMTARTVRVPVAGNWRAVVRYRRLPPKGGLARGLKGRFVDVTRLRRSQWRRLRLRPEIWVWNPSIRKFEVLGERVNARFKGFARRKRLLSSAQVMRLLDAAGYRAMRRGNWIEVGSP